MRLLFALLAVITLSCSTCYGADNRGYRVKIGDMAPNFSATTSDGNEFQLSQLKGKVVLLQFTASWCGVCRVEMPHIEKRIWQRFKEKGLVIYGIDRDEPLEKVNAFIKQTNITYPMALDPGAKIFTLFANRNAGVTRNILIDRNGKIVFLTRLFNEQEFELLIKKIETQLKQ